MSESVLEGTLKFPSTFSAVDGCYSSFPSQVPSSNCRYSLADSLFSAFQAGNSQKLRANAEELATLYSIPPRSNSGSSTDALRFERMSCFEPSGRDWPTHSGSPQSKMLGHVNGVEGPNSFDKEHESSLLKSFASSISSVKEFDQVELKPRPIHAPSGQLSMPMPTAMFSSAAANDSINGIHQPLEVMSRYEPANDSLATMSNQLDEQPSLVGPLQSNEKQTNFLQKLASTISPSAVGETKLTMTERIQVPSSDHVAEIVGKNGQRIRHLREQLKVWVKTPARDELPVFEITGMPEKLGEAKRIILQMSEHFSKVQQERLNRIEPNRAEERLYVEQDKVGLIVGASGQTIRWVQQLSDTHIATPRKQESIPGLPSPQTHFTICGTRERVRFAKQLICEYVSLRCQGLWLDSELESSPEAAQLVHDFHARRQAEDTQRRGSAPAGVTLTALSRQSAPGEDSSSAPASQTLAEVKRLWQEGGPPPAVWDGVLFGGLPPTSVPPPPLPLISDRRYSVDAQSVAQHHRQQQQQQLQKQQQQATSQQQQQQRQFLFGLDLDGLDQLTRVKSYSDDLGLQAGSCVNGWM